VLPIALDIFDGVIRDAGIGVEASLHGFARGFEAAAGGGAPEMREPPRAEVSPSALPAQIAATFPKAAHAMLGAGYARLVEFQDRAYAELYVERLRTILAAERVAGGSAAHGYPTTRETARFLALWMAFDDVVRVASLKCRARRFARVRREVGAGADDVVRIVDYLKPGMPEIAGLLPLGTSRRLIAWDRKRQARGKPPIAFAVHLRSDSIAGFALLRFLSGLRWLRRRGTRYAEEQTLIERWLAAVARATRADWRLGHELALCGRLIKGYGATNERGKRNLLHIVDHLAERPGIDAAARAEAVREAREAALADEAGTALDATLVRHGAPPRPARTQPIVWTQKRPAPARGAVS
jgi:indolepyruvate ferredoxin oxidoreductase beta subunit